MSSLLDAAERITSLVTGRQSQHLEVPSADSAALLSVTAHHISEKMGEPVVLTVLVSHPRAISRRDYLNQEASFSLTADDGTTRKWSGFISSFSKIKTTNDFVSYEIVVKSHLARLQGIRDTKIYQHKTIPQILEAILVRHKFKPHQYLFRLRGVYPQTLFRFQYAQDDLAYLQMLMTKWGIYLYVEETEYGDRIVFADDIDHYIYDPDRAVPYRENAGMEASIESVYELACRTFVVPQAMVVADYNPDKAWERFKAEENVAPQDPTTYGKPYIYGTAHLDQAEAQRKAQLYHEEAICWQVVFEGRSNVQELRCGRVFRTDAELPDAEDGLVVVEVTHGGARDKAYSNTFKAIPASRRFRLKIDESKWPKIAGTLSGRVTSPDKYKYAYLTAAGYYTVRFDVDFDEWPKGGESVPLRLAKPFAGALQTGFHFPGLDDTEVVIGFRDGDPDKPELLGFHHNSQAVDHITNDRRWLSRNVIRTQSNNKLRMEDWAGEEGIKLSTEHSGKSQLSLGYLVDSKLEKRGEGFELRSSGYGAIRGGKGLFISADDQPGGGGQQLDMQAARGLLQEALQQSEALASVAAAAQAIAADYDRQKALLHNILTALKRAGILVSAPAGMALTSGADLQMSAAENLIGTAGGHADFSVLKRFTVAAGEAVSIFAQKLGAKLFAASGKVEISALSDDMRLSADQDMTVTSIKGRVTIEAKQELLLKCGGSYIRLSSTGIEDGTRGDRTIKSAAFSRQGPSSLAQSMNAWKHANFDEQFVLKWPFDNKPVQNQKFSIIREDGSVISGVTDSEGKTGLQKSLFVDGMRLRIDPD
ncbi:type VI secretion system Vgr family protein [Caballeronia sp. AZ1_KS37]|uniref:type VI secretion system Vgr family protein n=1 Tax=Caballeronia sp. AZ1_KS37 TaxID=2921756 RepID=UPI0020283AA4|nr:type VI secretion system Vgr family protein [Caballeronia sp. AZ1_KS37]